ncbi:hypothetical protein [Streptacidiphilus sp. BW17]|uniref:hypothetical protein n=1 Tax=Streptacidiphilus sp. BW17 TaxID=3156274 RepID=UPI003519A428
MAMNASNRNERNGLPLSVTIVTSGWTAPSSSRRQIDQPVPGQALGLGQGELDRCDRVVLVRGRGHVPAEFVLRPVVPAAGQTPDAA